jgi:hypothetical protein
MRDESRFVGILRCSFRQMRLIVGVLALTSLAACGQNVGAGGEDAAVAQDSGQPPSDIVASDGPADAGADTALTDAASTDATDQEDAVDVADLPDATDSDLLSDATDATALPDADATDGDVAGDAGTDAADVPPDVFGGCQLAANPAAGQPGATCVSDGDCDSGTCASAPEGKRCAPACTGAGQNCCPTGWACDKAGTTPMCAPKWTALCSPCTTDEQCDAMTTGSLCLKHGAEGYFCATPCALTSDCPSDYKCSFSYGTSGQDKVCVTPGACECNAAAIAMSAKTTCANSNSAGVCKGERMCSAGGLQLCDALVPSAETCNGIDDDCNGKTDEGMPDFDKDGVPDCDDPDMDADGAMNGSDCAPLDPQVFPGNKEKCNGADDNCDGLTDEGFKDLDSDGIADCVDNDLDGDGVDNVKDCSPTDGGVFQDNPEICDGKDQNCNKKIDEGFPDADKDGIADCVDPDMDGDGVANAADCSPTDKLVFPGQAETCDGKDNNCDGQTDEGFADLDKDSLADCIDPDIDGDGAANEADCAPSNAAIFPLALEVCNGVDDNCDGATDPGCDDDKDGYCDSALPADPTSVACPNGGGDCDDTHAAAHPGAAEICDTLDNNCDGVTDPGCDLDGDGYCVGNTPVSLSCPKGGSDCNDSDVDTHPGGTEICDNHDQNCDGKTDEGCDSDSDGYCAATVPSDAKFPACPSGGGDCNDNDKSISPAAIDFCNGKDDNCDGQTDPGCDSDGDGYCAGNVGVSAGCINGGGDCDDTNAGIHPKAFEACDDVDNDCANGVDDGCDVDGDGWCVFGAVVNGTPAVCSKGTGDCNDNQKSVYPGAPDLCDGLDNDCSGKIDVACDQDGDGWCDANRVTIGAPYVCLYGGGDCNDGEYAVHPQSPDVCDLLDNDCDGQTDVGCDVDGDGYCASGKVIVIGSGACVHGGGDCNDLSISVHPGLPELCDDLDNDCDKATDVGCDDDGDGWCDANMTAVGTPKICPHGGGDCNDVNIAVYPTHVEICDNFDNNCDGLTDTGCDDDGDHFCDAKMVTVGNPAVCANGGGDCDDTNAAVQPGTVEVCDGKDNNCISGTDEGCNDDGDAYCDAAMSTVGTPQICPSGGGDCDDTSAQINPGMYEICDDLDNNCLNGTDEGCDDDGDKWCDGQMVTSGLPKICAYGGGDCNDMDPLVGAVTSGSCFEKCDGLDNNNDGLTDENCDKDADGYCDSAMTRVVVPPISGVCAKGTTLVSGSCVPTVCKGGGGDCQDNNAAINPGKAESCATAFDDNCDGLTDSDGATGCTKYYYDIDGDGYGGASVCYCNSPNSKQTYGGASVDQTKAVKLAVIGTDASGVSFENNCPTGYLAIGVTGEYLQSPVYMVSFTLMCKKLNSDATLGISGVAPTSSAGSGPTFGGTCPNNEILTTEWGDQNGADAQHYAISRLGGHCATMSRIANQYTGWDDVLPNSPLLFDGGGTGLIERVCPVGYAVTGTYGHYSTWHGDFGYKCSPVSLSTTFQVFVSVGGDCNDYDASVKPTVTEQCDNLDNNCNGTTDEGCDGDGDGYCTTTKTVVGTPAACPKGGGDCADANAAVHPGVTDICDSIDNDCNSVIDPGCDKDGDLYCDSGLTVVGNPTSCPNGKGDCNDGNAAIHPGATESCDDVDQNCDGKVDEGCDVDLDGYCTTTLTVTGSPKICPKGKGDCADSNSAINPGVTEICDNIDNNCSGKVDETCDDDGDGWCRINATFVGNPSICSKGKTDCNDAKSSVYPGAPEICDGLDNSCSGSTDNGCDDDKDGYCDSAMGYVVGAACVHGGGDCNDGNASINPGAPDICGNGIDDDCSGAGTVDAASQGKTGSSVFPANQYDSSHWLAFSFTPNASGTLAAINGLQLLNWDSSPPSTALRVFSGGLPGNGGTQLGSSSQSVNSGHNWAAYNFGFGGIAVTKGVKYYAVILATDTHSGYMYTNTDNTGAWISSNSGNSWKDSGTYTFAVKVTITGIDGPVCQ